MNSIFRRGFACIVVLLACVGAVRANDLQIDNVHLIYRPGATGELRAVFDLSWRNAWHNERNHDGVFLKLVYGGQGVRHVKLAPDGHRVLNVSGAEAPPAHIDIARDSIGGSDSGGTGTRRIVLPKPSAGIPGRRARTGAGGVSQRLSSLLCDEI